MDEKEAWIALNAIPNVGSITFQRLLSKFGSASAIFSSSCEDITKLAGLNPKVAENIKKFDVSFFLKNELSLINRYKVEIILAKDSNYPGLLKEIYSYPLVLYIRGHLNPHPTTSIAIVGTRYPTGYGQNVAKKFGEELAKLKITVVSGLAKGIDTAAHLGTLCGGGYTIAVLGCGVNVAYPPENKNLMDQIIEKGAIISEFAMSKPPEKRNFPIRNRVISGLSIGTIVIEAASKSGSLITADYALDQGREVFALPGNINSQNSQGTNSLIKQGAKLVTGILDVLEEIAPQMINNLMDKPFPERNDKTGISQNNIEETVDSPTTQPFNHSTAQLSFSNDEKIIYQTLREHPLHIDEITRKTSLPVGKVLGFLTTLELKGAVEQVTANHFVRKC
ncbi:MAG: DNA-processing protein DprA [bacterium]